MVLMRKSVELPLGSLGIGLKKGPTGRATIAEIQDGSPLAGKLNEGDIVTAFKNGNITLNNPTLTYLLLELKRTEDVAFRELTVYIKGVSSQTRTLPKGSIGVKFRRGDSEDRATIVGFTPESPLKTEFKVDQVVSKIVTKCYGARLDPTCRDLVDILADTANEKGRLMEVS